MANPNDGTQLGTGEVISDEYVDPSVGVRRDPNLPPAAYKLARSKIAVGPYGQDQGDATPDVPLPVESRAERWALELASLRDRERAVEQLSRSSADRYALCDARGQHLDTRGSR